MARVAAFLRAINVGGHTVTMDRLRAILGDGGITGVETFIASGNLVVEAGRRKPASLEREIAALLEAELGYPVETFVRTFPELVAILDSIPFEASEVNDAFALMIGMMHGTPEAAARNKAEALSGKVDTLHVVGRELHWLRLARESDPGLGKPLEKLLGRSMTVRNANTLRRMIAKYGE